MLDLRRSRLTAVGASSESGCSTDSGKIQDTLDAMVAIRLTHAGKGRGVFNNDTKNWLNELQLFPTKE